MGRNFHALTLRAHAVGVNVYLNAYGIWGSGVDDIYAVGVAGTILHSSNGGQTWSPTTAGPAGTEYRAVWGSGATDVYVAGANGVILHSTDGGRNWTTSMVGTNELRSIWGSSSANVFAVGTGGVIVHSADHGMSWQSQTSGLEPVPSDGGVMAEAILEDVWGSSATDVYSVGLSSVLHTTDGGRTWAKQRAQINFARGVWGSGANDVYIAAAEGAILHSIDGGQNWMQESTPVAGTTLDVYSLWGSGAMQVFAVGKYGMVLRRQ